MRRTREVMVALAFLGLAACEAGGGRADVVGPLDVLQADLGGGDTGAAEDTGASPALDARGDDSREDVAHRSAHYVYEPGGLARPTFPDDYYTEEDASTATGLRVSMRSDNALWFGELDTFFRAVYEGVNALDGWGTNAAVVLNFDGPLAPLPEGEAETRANGAVMMVELGAEGPRRVPFVTELTGDHSVLLWPMFPLRPKTRHGVVVTREQKDANGGELGTAEALAAALEGHTLNPRLQALAPRYDELLQALDLGPADVVAAVVFTTQSVVEESVAIADDIASRSVEWSVPPVCAANGEHMRRCEGTATFHTYRDENLVVAGSSPSGTNEMHVSLWLPELGSPDLRGPGPWPTLVYGHGLQHERGQARGVAKFVVPQGAVVAAIDAPGHGEHPTAPEDTSLALFAFFAANVDTSPVTVDPLVMRDNFRESTYDKLQLLRLLEEHPDIDGDGTDDVDTARFGYMGESFGGIMSIETAALQDRFDVVGLQLGGARVATMIKEARRFSVFTLMMKPRGGSEHDVTRLFPVLQTAIERGDPANYAPHVLGERLPDAGTRHPHFLLQLVIDDDTIPEVANRALTRALGLPHVPPRPGGYDGVPLAGPAPLSLNVLEGSRTAGFFQFDRIRRNPEAAVEAATHDFMPSSEEGEAQFRHFMDTWLDPDAAPEIIDPYDLLATPSL